MAVLYSPTRTLQHDLIKFSGRKFTYCSTRTYSGWNRVRKSINDKFETILYLSIDKISFDQSHSAVYVISNSSGRYDPRIVIHSCNSTNWKSITFMNIRHSNRISHYARECSDIFYLMNRTVFLEQIC